MWMMPLHVNKKSDYDIYDTTLLAKFYPVNMQQSNFKYVFTSTVENSLDLYQMASSEAS